jgi:heat-inducible transcriptional repressor
MPPLDSRKVRILQAIVNDYVATTKPVGSERLIEVVKLGCKPATIRNEMAEMAEMGYLAQPHTSAGRIPTDRGYRYYVDALMDPPSALSSEEARRAQAHTQQAQNEVEEMILQTCRILSGLTSYPSLATDPATEIMRVRRVYLTEADARHILLVMLLSTGHVEHRLVEVPAAPDTGTLLRVSNYLNSRVADCELDEAARLAGGLEAPPEVAAPAPLLKKLFTVIRQMARGLSERRVFLEGASQFLRQPEFQDVQRLENLLHALEQRSALYAVLSRALRDCDVTIIIGSENEYEPMQECSVITTSYRIGTRPAGYLGVVGPTRMQYDRAAAAVGLMAQNLSRMLTNLYLA